jgi:hypothetical protein
MCSAGSGVTKPQREFVYNHRALELDRIAQDRKAILCNA